MPFQMSLWLKIVVLGIGIAAAGVVGVFSYRYFTAPTTLTVAAGKIDGESANLMTALAARLKRDNSSVRLKVVPVDSALDAAQMFAAGKVDMAVVRADVGDLSEVRSVVVLAQGVVMLLVPPGSSIDSVDALKGKTVGVVGGVINHPVVDALKHEYDLAGAKVTFKDIAPADARQALHTKQVSALLLVTPLTEKYLSLVRNAINLNPKQKPALIAIESAGAIANVARAYESYDIPKGTLRGSPPIPDDDLTTLRVSYYLVANPKLNNDNVADLTRAIMSARRELIAEFPLLAGLSAPSTDKDAYIPIHPGAAEYYGDTEQDFFDKYSNQLYYGPMIIGALGSALVAAWKFMGFGGGGAPAATLDQLHLMARRIRNAKDDAELEAIEDEIDAILKAELAEAGKKDDGGMEAVTVNLIAHRLGYLVHYRRSMLHSHSGPVPAA